VGAKKNRSRQANLAILSPSNFITVVHSIAAAILTAVPLMTVRCQFELGTSYFVPLAVGAVAIVVFPCFFQSQRLHTSLPPLPTGTDLLIDRVNDYLIQRDARKAQRPWLISSLIAFVTAYVTFAFGPETTYSRCWLIACVLAALAGMAFAGIFAEDSPPRDGMEEILAFVRFYAPLNPAKYQELLTKITSGTWTNEDLVTFASLEEDAARIEARGHQAAQLLTGTVPSSKGAARQTDSEFPRPEHEVSKHVAVATVAVGIAYFLFTYFDFFSRFDFRPAKDPDNTLTFAVPNKNHRVETKSSPAQPGIELTPLLICQQPPICKPSVGLQNIYATPVTLAWSVSVNFRTVQRGFTALNPALSAASIQLVSLGSATTFVFEFADVHTRGVPIDNNDSVYIRSDNWSAWMRPNPDFPPEARARCGPPEPGKPNTWLFEWRNMSDEKYAFTWQARTDLANPSPLAFDLVLDARTPPERSDTTLDCGTGPANASLYLSLLKIARRSD